MCLFPCNQTRLHQPVWCTDTCLASKRAPSGTRTARLTHLLFPFWRSHCFLPHHLEIVREMLGPVYFARRSEPWGWGSVNLFYLCAVPCCCSLTSKEEAAFLN